MPIQLPPNPIDRFRIDWWRLNHDHDAREPRHAVYYVDAPWAEVVPDDPDRAGEPFVDDFAIYEGGCLSGRNSWEGLRTCLESEGVFARESEAIEALRAALLSRVEYLEKESARLRRRLADLEGATD